jgi:hypothetical protein
MLLFIAAPPLAAKEDYEFEVRETEKKAFELGGYFEHAPTYMLFNQDSAMYKLRYYGVNQSALNLEDDFRLQLYGTYLKKGFKLYAETFSTLTASTIQGAGSLALFQGYGEYTPSSSLSINAGKRTLKWGKGYAWNPVAFLDTPKDPNDPSLPRQGLTVISADFTRTFPSALKTLTFTPVLVPVLAGVNGMLGTTEGWNLGSKLYMLLYDTDIDLILLGGPSLPFRWGLDFSKNITPALEVHGEYADISAYTQNYLNENFSTATNTFDVRSFLIGARYQTKTDTTFILEYYRNGTGYTKSETDNFFSFVNSSYDYYLSTGNSTQLNRASNMLQSGYGIVNPLQEYLYLRATQTDAFRIAYFNPSLTCIYNMDDKSFSLSPELLYSPSTNVELRLKPIINLGGSFTEFGEKAARMRMEFRMRYYF